MKRIDGQDISNLIFGDKELLIDTLKLAYTHAVCVDVATDEVITIQSGGEGLIERVQGLKWSELREQLIESTVFDQRAIVRPFFDERVIKKLEKDGVARFSFRNNFLSEAGQYNWHNVMVKRIHIDNKNFLLYLANDVASLFDDVKTNTGDDIRDKDTLLYSYSYIADMIKSEYVKLDSCSVLMLRIEEIDVSDDISSNRLIARGAEAALMVRRGNHHLYRYDEDTILVVIMNGSNEEAEQFRLDWQEKMNAISVNDNIKYLLVTGIASQVVPFSVYDLIEKCERIVYTKKLKYESEAILEAEDRIAKQRIARIRECLEVDYLSIWEIDLENDYYELVSENKDPKCGSYPACGRYSETYEKLCNQYVSERSRAEKIRIGSIENLREALKTESRVECEFETADFACIWRRSIFQVVEYEDGIPKKVVKANVAIDNSEVERMRQQKTLVDAFQQQQERSDARMDFLSKISHDIRTPLNAIIGMTMIARKSVDDRATLDECLDKISDASAQMLSMVNEILDIRKIEAGALDISNEVFSIGEIELEIRDVLMPVIREHRHSLLINVHDIEQEMVVGDIHRIHRIVNNIVTNSAKYTPDGGELSVDITQTHAKAADMVNIHMTFTDNGVGMSEEFLSKLFDPFTRAYDSRLEGRTGTGLGMAITKNLIIAMGGTIAIDSKIDHGTTTVIDIPVKLYYADDFVVPKHVCNAGVLFVCDSECDERKCTISGRCLKEILLSKGISIDDIRIGEDPAPLIASKREQGMSYYAVVINSRKYTETVADTIKEIRKQIGGGTPMVLTLADDWLNIELDARARGINFFLRKPVLIKDVSRIFKTIYDQSIYNDESVEEDGIPDCTGKRILVAEDNDINAEIITEILSVMGASVDRAANGLIAFEMMRDVPDGWYDLILMDIEMPEMNGYEATEKIRALDREDVKDIPIVAMTANAFSADADRALSVGMNEHLTKPVEIDRLEKMLREYIL